MVGWEETTKQNIFKNYTSVACLVGSIFVQNQAAAAHCIYSGFAGIAILKKETCYNKILLDL